MLLGSFGGLGIIFWDNRGEVMACAAKGIVDAWDITISKARTVAFDLSLALDLSFYRLIAEFDYKTWY